MILTKNDLQRIAKSWDEALDKLKAIPIKPTEQCVIASSCADFCIGAIRGTLRHLEDRDPVNAFRIMRTILEAIVKFKCLLANPEFVKDLLNDYCYGEKKLYANAKGSDGVGLEILKDKLCPIDTNKSYEKLNFKDLCRKIGWMQQYNLIYWHTSELSHGSLKELLSSIIAKGEEGIELLPHGESTREEDYSLALNLMKWFAQQFSLAVDDFKQLNQANI